MTPPPFFNGTAATKRDTTRSQRGRIIVLGDQPLIETIAGATHRPTTFARHMYDVIGDLVQTGILDAPDAIVASLESLGVKAGTFVEAVRRVDPSVELIAIAAEDGQAPGALGGFDSYLAPPLDDEALEWAIQGHAGHAGHTDRRAAASADQAIEAGFSGQRNEPAGEIQGASPSQASTSGGAGPMPLGDVDLVSALQGDPAELESLALRMIEQEAGFRGLRLDPAPSRTAPCASVRCGAEAAYGYLVAGDASGNVGPATVTAIHLQPWADWLAHWLHLARSVADLREQAHTDQLTGAYNRRYFEQHLTQALAEARSQRQCVSLLLFDIDDFKKYNDKYGHAAGDEILVETVKLLRSVIRPNDRVCRIGGDEFVVIFHDPQGQRERGSSHPDDIQKIARRFQQQICQHRFPKLSAEARGTLTISGGLATFPWDGADVPALLERADRNALASKRSGKNAITFGPDATDVCQGAASATEPPER